jgi:ribosome-binding factor A
VNRRERWNAPHRFFVDRSARGLRLKRTPELRFIHDDSIAGQDRIEQILNELHETRGSVDASEDSKPSRSPKNDDDDA